jgi:hypothetical protein
MTKVLAPQSDEMHMTWNLTTAKYYSNQAWHMLSDLPEQHALTLCQ